MLQNLILLHFDFVENLVISSKPHIVNSSSKTNSPQSVKSRMGKNERDFCPFLFPSAVYGAYPSSSPSSTASPPSSPPPSYSCTHSSSSLSITSPFVFPSTTEFSSSANFNQQCTQVHGSSNTINFLQQLEMEMEFRPPVTKIAIPLPPPAVAPAAGHQQPANMWQSGEGFDINLLFQEAQIRWLKPAEVLFILQNHENYELSQERAKKPIGGSLFLFNKRVLRFFRRDGHNWRKKKDGRTVGEAHERVKVGNVEALNCYYAHGEQNSNFQRRSYWMLDPAYKHIVLVHYRDVSEVGFSPSPTSYTTQNQDCSSRVSGLHNPYHGLSSPSSIKVSSEVVAKDDGLDNAVEFTSSTNDEP